MRKNLIVSKGLSDGASVTGNAMDSLLLYVIYIFVFFCACVSFMNELCKVKV